MRSFFGTCVCVQGIGIENECYAERIFWKAKEKERQKQTNSKNLRGYLHLERRDLINGKIAIAKTKYIQVKKWKELRS